MKPTIEETIEQYVAAWNMKTLNDYKTEFAKCWAVDGVYIDPDYFIEGLDGLVGLAYKSLDIIPQRIFSIVVSPKYHHNVGHYTWKVDLPNNLSREGYDYFEFNDEHLITHLVSFFAPL